MELFADMRAELAALAEDHSSEVQSIASSACEECADASSDGDARILLLALALLASLGSLRRGSPEYAAAVAKFREDAMSARSVTEESALKAVKSAALSAAKASWLFCRRWLAVLSGASRPESLSREDAAAASESADGSSGSGVYNGMTMEENIAAVMALDVDRAVKAVLNADSARAAARSGQIPAETAAANLEKAFRTTRRQLSLNAAMLVNGAANDAAVAFSEENGSEAPMVVWLTERDGRVCDDCASLDGVEFKAQDAPPCPYHPNCRCILAPSPGGSSGAFGGLLS